MMFPRICAAIAAASLVALALPAAASEKLTFPSANGVSVVSTTPHFGNQSPGTLHGDGVGLPGVPVTKFGSLAVYGTGDHHVPLPPPTAYDERFGRRSREADAYAFRFLTHALSAASYANYAADYYRLFAPNYAVTVWTDRVAGLVEAGYGGAVDSWTAGAYYLGRARGPRHRRETAPDLSTMPKFRPHPELEGVPTFIPND